MLLPPHCPRVPRPHVHTLLILLASLRINSTVHAALVCTLVAICLLTMSFDPVTLVPLGSTALLEVTFSICKW